MIKNWSNTALVAYSAIPEIISHIDFGVKTRINSTFQSVHLRNGVSNEKLIGEILELNAQKRSLILLREKVGEALNVLNESERMILVCRLCKKLTFKEISKGCEIPMRTLFRRFEAAQSKFATVLSSVGYSESKLEEEFGTGGYLLDIYNRLNEDKYFVAKSSRNGKTRPQECITTNK